MSALSELIPPLMRLVLLLVGGYSSPHVSLTPSLLLGPQGQVEPRQVHQHDWERQLAGEQHGL